MIVKLFDSDGSGRCLTYVRQRIRTFLFDKLWNETLGVIEMLHRESYVNYMSLYPWKIEKNILDSSLRYMPKLS